MPCHGGPAETRGRVADSYNAASHVGSTYQSGLPCATICAMSSSFGDVSEAVFSASRNIDAQNGQAAATVSAPVAISSSARDVDACLSLRQGTSVRCRRRSRKIARDCRGL